MKKLITYTVLSLFLLMVLFPFIWMVLTAVKPQAEALTISIVPKHITLNNFVKVFVQYNFMRYSLNSFIVAFVSAVVSTLFASMAAYAFAKKTFRFKNLLFALFLSSMMVPGLLYVVPQFAIVYGIGWVNTYLGMIVPHLANVFGMFMLTQFMKGIPDSLIEAAKIDGASEFKIFAKIMVPLTAPAIATVFLLNFQFHWNNFLWQLIVYLYLYRAIF